jgi:hypothetical protein
MNIVQTLNRRLEAIAWGVFFVWWGITELFPVLPEGAGVIGIGVILLGLNLARSVNGIPTSGFTITLGILALVLGTLEFSRQLLRLPFDLPIFGILLIVLGVIFLVRELTGKQSQPG